MTHATLMASLIDGDAYRRFTRNSNVWDYLYLDNQGVLFGDIRAEGWEKFDFTQITFKEALDHMENGERAVFEGGDYSLETGHLQRQSKQALVTIEMINGTWLREDS